MSLSGFDKFYSVNTCLTCVVSNAMQGNILLPLSYTGILGGKPLELSD